MDISRNEITQLIETLPFDDEKKNEFKVQIDNLIKNGSEEETMLFVERLRLVQNSFKRLQLEERLEQVTDLDESDLLEDAKKDLLSIISEEKEEHAQGQVEELISKLKQI